MSASNRTTITPSVRRHTDTLVGTLANTILDTKSAGGGASASEASGGHMWQTLLTHSQRRGKMSRPFLALRFHLPEPKGLLEPATSPTTGPTREGQNLDSQLRGWAGLVSPLHFLIRANKPVPLFCGVCFNILLLCGKFVTPT